MCRFGLWKVLIYDGLFMTSRDQFGAPVLKPGVFPFLCADLVFKKSKFFLVYIELSLKVETAFFYKVQI